ncbi:nuclear transport factor 2 family protein [Actinacidiphila glaucinigra]|uniref:nuclear transport factor 2 family protein n=1 Tax=Actinacidiphila glaucinigra TaxID=235986 RepID=UPI00371FDD06
MITTQQVAAWLEAYVHAWATAAADDIEALFTPDAEYHELPYETSWVGRDRIVEGWLSRRNWQEGGWTFDWKILMVSRRHRRCSGDGRLQGVGDLRNLWVVTLDPYGRCSMFRMWNNEV